MVLEPLWFYVLHRASLTIQDRGADATLKLFVLDEAWRFARDATVKAYITQALKTWRKRNATLVLATQSSEDFADPGLAADGRRELPDEGLSRESRDGSRAGP